MARESQYLQYDPASLEITINGQVLRGHIRTLYIETHFTARTTRYQRIMRGIEQ